MASDIRIGTASLNTAMGTTSRSAQRAATASRSASAGNRAPSTMRSPNQVEPGVACAPRSRRTVTQARIRQAAMTPSSMSAEGLKSASTSWPNSSAEIVRPMGYTSASTRTCAATLRASAPRW
jgi:hypothetical protein